MENKIQPFLSLYHKSQRVYDNFCLFNFQNKSNSNEIQLFTRSLPTQNCWTENQGISGNKYLRDRGWDFLIVKENSAFQQNFETAWDCCFLNYSLRSISFLQKTKRNNTICSGFRLSPENTQKDFSRNCTVYSFLVY